MTEGNDGKRFCTHCGAALPEGSSFCPYCGTGTDGGRNTNGPAEPSPYAEYARYNQRGPDNLGSTPLLILMYGIFAMMFGIMATAGSGMVTEELWNEVYPDMPFDQMYVTIAMVAGATGILSGLLAAVSGILSMKRVKYKAAFYTCIGASVLSVVMGMGVVGIITAAIGILMALRLRNNKDAFAN